MNPWLRREKISRRKWRFTKGVPAITVIVDGGRYHCWQIAYNSNSCNICDFECPVHSMHNIYLSLLFPVRRPIIIPMPDFALYESL